MSDAYAEDNDVVVAVVVAPVADARTAQLDKLREKLSKFGDRAVDILTELAEFAENERVRLAAAESILDRVGVGKTQNTQVTVSTAEHEIATREAEEMVARLAKNHGTKELQVKPALETLIVLEGEDVTLPTAAEAPARAVEATSTEV